MSQILAVRQRCKIVSSCDVEAKLQYSGLRKSCRTMADILGNLAMVLIYSLAARRSSSMLLRQLSCLKYPGLQCRGRDRWSLAIDVVSDVQASFPGCEPIATSCLHGWHGVMTPFSAFRCSHSGCL